MGLFWLEYLHFIAAITAILVSISAFALFLLTFKYEQQLRTVWRAVGFLLLAIAFLLFILERKFGGFALPGLVTLTLGLISIWRGVLAEPKLSQLRKTKKVSASSLKKSRTSIFKLLQKPILVFAVLILLLVIVLAVVFWVAPAYGTFLLAFLNAALEVASLIFVILTIAIQIRRYRGEKGDSAVRRQNLWPLLGYLFLVVRGLGAVLYRLPDLNIVFLHQFRLDFSIAWQMMVWGTFLAFFFLGIWAWNFIKVRVFLRTYVVFLSIAIVVSTLGALVFTTLIFRIVETNNLNLMEQGAETQQLITEDRANTALFIAKTMASDDIMVAAARNNDSQNLKERTEDYLMNSNLDILRVYNTFGEVIASPSDDRDVGRVFNKDSLVAFSLTEKKLVKSFEKQDGVLAPMIVARALHPLVVGSTVIGVVEAGYVFDNAFVDFSKEKTGLDVTVYADDLRSATTIRTEDGVSRWVGSEENDSEVVTMVLGDGESVKKVVDRLGQVYYAAFEPVRDVNGEIIGMVSVGVPTQVLFENTRQQLVSSFLIVTLISLLAAVLGYYALFSRKRRESVS